MPTKKSTTKASKKITPPHRETAQLPVSPPAQPAPPTPTAPVTIPVASVEDPESSPPASVVHPPEISPPTPTPESSEGPSASFKEFASLPTTSSSTVPASHAEPSVEPVSSPTTPPITPISTTPTPETPAPSGPPPPKKSWVWVILLILLVAGLVVAGFAVYSAVFSTTSSTPDASQDQEPTSTPTPTSTTEAVLDRATLKVQVLNGSGIPGKAGEVKTLLESLGYTSIDTGNADTYDYAQTEISVPDDRTDILDLLTADLEKEYELSDQAGALPENSDYDAVVVVGQN